MELSMILLNDPNNLLKTYFPTEMCSLSVCVTNKNPDKYIGDLYASHLRDDLMRELKELNSADIEIYEFAKALFFHRIYCKSSAEIEKWKIHVHGNSKSKKCGEENRFKWHCSELLYQ
jgi:hypothetical protein